MSWVVTAVVGTTAVIGGATAIAGADAQRKAAHAAEDAANAATQAGVDIEEKKLNQAIKYYQPFWNAGVKGLDQLQRTASGAKAPDLPSTTIDFKFDPNDEMYKIQQEEGEKSINRALAARGMYNSRPGINALSDFNRKLIAEETQRQYGRAVDKYNRDYTSAIDEFNIKNKLAGQEYGKWLDVTKIGAGAGSSAGAASVQTGQDIASSYNRLGEIGAQTNLAIGQSKLDAMNTIGGIPMNALAGYYYGGKAGLW